jgi:hypothetical protein
MDEHELEQVLRDGLERRATDADVTAPVVARARAEVSRRRRTRWGVGAAAAAAVLVVGGVAVATGDREEDADPPTVVDDDTSADSLPEPAAEWRTEYWASVAVDVPSDWGYGGAPFDDGTACYPEAMVAADGSRIARAGDRGWVGRPIAATDVCASVPRAWEPTAPYVWLGAAVGPGTLEYDNGYVQETVEVARTTVTVGATDASLREQVLGSVRVAEDGVCPPTYPGVPTGSRATMANGAMGPPFAWVCAYRRTDDGGFDLSYAATVDREAASAAVQAQTEAPAQQADCDYDANEFVVLETAAPGGRVARTVYETGCAGGTVSLGDGLSTEMVAAGVEPWAHNGIPAVVYGPSGGKGAMLDAFIGPQG